MSDRHVVVGAGPVGRHVARLLAERGTDVTVVSRTGTSTRIADVRHEKLDASDSDQLSAVADGASVLYNCANPADYTSWTSVWPPLAASFLEAAERSGAVLAITGNLYPYGPVNGPMVEGMPDAATDTKGMLRAAMWADAQNAHDEGRIRTVEVRSADYVGTGVGNNGHVTRVLPSAMKGKHVRVIGDANQPHTWTDVLDTARTLIAAAEDDSAHGRIWHAPSNVPRTQREAINDVLAAAGKPPVKVTAVPDFVLSAGARFVPLVREIRDMSYQFKRPYVLDSWAAREHFGMEPTPWDAVCRRTAVLQA
ncbi:MAG: NAD-dependent epimerase/dehydratase family protein [Aeromicrobium sp.]